MKIIIKIIIAWLIIAGIFFEFTLLMNGGDWIKAILVLVIISIIIIELILSFYWLGF